MRCHLQYGNTLLGVECKYFEIFLVYFWEKCSGVTDVIFEDSEHHEVIHMQLNVFFAVPFPAN